MHYHIWTEGCQMNVADSQRVSSALEKLGYQRAARPEQADVIVLNTCVVRQSAEDKAYGRLTSLYPLKEERPDLVINLMGCLVGVRGHEQLQARFPYVDVFSPPSDPAPLVRHLSQRLGRVFEQDETATRFALMDGELPLPAHERGGAVTAFVPVVYGCSHACTFCIIPFRRGPERSRALGEVVAEVRSLAAQGVREVTLLGQIVDRYGRDVPDGPSLAQLLRQVHEVEGLERIRFLTSHPNWMTDDLLDAVAELPKVCEHIEVPVQAGDDDVLQRMKRGYTVRAYRELVERIRRRVPGASIATDVIVGFPGESVEQFESTRRLLEDLQLDVVHLARYSPRPGTVSARRMPDDVAETEKVRRFRILEEQQTAISESINHALIGQTVEVLAEGPAQERWRGRTRTNKLVFFDADGDWRGRTVRVRVEAAGAWSLRGSPEPEPFDVAQPLLPQAVENGRILSQEEWAVSGGHR